ncbi:MAG TPA: hypothetical protein VM889_14980 [Candidatus Thermoplasmatota archaeon]|nr:hypothetical protein [Candidatus Thermoplasmatota archaeon]
MGARCDECGQPFANAEEVDQHKAMVHDARWRGRSALSESGDENAVGAVSAKTADTLSPRPARARERAARHEEDA